jgi:predicted nicotinamide N-methyase
MPLALREVLPGGPRMYVPVDPDALLDELLEGTDDAAFRASDEKMPYFALLWPAGESLAARVREGPSLRGRRVLDLGCGLAPSGLVAAAGGADVTFLDWEPRALEIVAMSLALAGLRGELVRADWRSPPTLQPFDLILAADVLYEERNLPAVVAFLASHLADGGEAWVADPGRRHAAGFPEAAAGAPLRVLEDAILPPRPHGRDIRLWRLAR